MKYYSKKPVKFKEDGFYIYIRCLVYKSGNVREKIDCIKKGISKNDDEKKRINEQRLKKYEKDKNKQSLKDRRHREYLKVKEAKRIKEYKAKNAEMDAKAAGEFEQREKDRLEANKKQIEREDEVFERIEKECRDKSEKDLTYLEKQARIHKKKKDNEENNRKELEDAKQYYDEQEYMEEECE